MEPTSEIRIVTSASDLFKAAAGEFLKLANQAVRDRGRFCVALSGGSTPKGLYSLLASGKIEVPWKDIYFFWGDERHVPAEDPESNYRMANEALLSRVPVDHENIFRIHSEETDASVAAKQYEQTLIKVFDLKGTMIPCFDLVLLGIGPEGHTASLFPNTAALEEKTRLVVANWVDNLKTDRITLTLPVLNNAREVMFMVSGEEKAPIVKEILQGDGPRLPAQMIQPSDGKLVWMLDKAAASQLSADPHRVLR